MQLTEALGQPIAQGPIEDPPRQRIFGIHPRPRLGVVRALERPKGIGDGNAVVVLDERCARRPRIKQSVGHDQMAA